MKTSRIRNDIKVHDCAAEDFETIKEKYDLEVQSRNGSSWITLEIPEARTEITWFKRNED